MISVIIPAYNCRRSIAKAIDSALRQTVKEEVELIIIDDASEDGTRQTVERIMEENPDRIIRFHRNKENLGVAKTRNIGIRMANGEYIAFLDADDWWDREKLAKQAVLIRKTDAPLVYTGREMMRPGQTAAGKTVKVPETADYKSLLRTNYIPCSSVLMKTDVAREFYMCRSDLHEDYILWLRVLKKYKKAYGINEPLLKSGLSEGGKSRNKLKSARMHYGVYRYLGIPVWKAIGLFFCYAVNGIRKYR